MRRWPHASVRPRPALRPPLLDAGQDPPRGGRARRPADHGRARDDPRPAGDARPRAGRRVELARASPRTGPDRILAGRRGARSDRVPDSGRDPGSLGRGRARDARLAWNAGRGDARRTVPGRAWGGPPVLDPPPAPVHPRDPAVQRCRRRLDARRAIPGRARLPRLRPRSGALMTTPPSASAIIDATITERVEDRGRDFSPF